MEEKKERILRYEEFRTGLRFSDITAELRNEAEQVFEAEGRRMFWSRHTVLGRWRQHKLSAYQDYLRYMKGSK